MHDGGSRPAAVSGFDSGGCPGLRQILTKVQASPERILFISELPKGLTGKVQRRALKELLAHATGA
jgi:hypothetical protein